ncbi:hypothetical protein AOL_s00004g148 [Orbilia oligospora ATCC 24927]|uniref:FAD-binding PCMH-type domain-containing protein n=1 Tax=Arthrobotrys oligospora (strain ATCC 24927 / CBS 115.81 / DSM 1491) TaxID=756982 RepID=G1WXY8_ARTOA|nr:hypothetical protein AOL_s00004g148 [Orbilia oligospora ATCC 24927]EGX54115.1 hypothetical protein AOL_s00004g148 [Orbilia oligospora ATCC 24927]
MEPQPIREAILEISQTIKRNEELDKKHFPGMSDLMQDYYDGKVDNEETLRRLMKVYKDSEDDDYSQVLDKYDADEKDALNAYLDGTKSSDDAAKEFLSRPPLVTRELFQKLEEAKKVQENVPAPKLGLPNEDPGSSGDNREFLPEPGKKFGKYQAVFIEGEKEPIPGLRNLKFENWGRTIQNTPQWTFLPDKPDDVRMVVKHAQQNKKGVRVSGFRHSWSPIFGRGNDQGQGKNQNTLISTLDLSTASILPNFTAEPWRELPEPIQLNSITERNAQFVNGPDLGNGKKYVRIGTSVTHEQLRRWCILNDVTLPMSIIMVEITAGGSNAPICHGGGIRHKTMSDIVRKIEYVDANANCQEVDMSTPDLLKAVAGCFGLVGVVTHITLELDGMTAAVLRPKLVDVIDAVPPPPEMKHEDIPKAIRPKRPRTDEEKRKAQEEFERKANSDYYSEWFWFPYSGKVWVNCWSNDTDLRNLEDFPGKWAAAQQIWGTIAVALTQKAKKAWSWFISEYHQTIMLTWLAEQNLLQIGDKEKPIRTALPNALHFQRGIQNIQVRDLEIELPLHAKKDNPNARDYTNVQRAWWKAIIEAYNNTEQSPMRMPLEMRMVGDSDIIMAPQRGNKLGTCAIEILTLKSAGEDGTWQPFAQKVLDIWMRDCSRDNDGNKLNVRPHWAKEWDNFKVDGKPWREVLKNESYKDQIVEFKSALTKLGEIQGWTLSDIKERYSNELFDYLFFDDV